MVVNCDGHFESFSSMEIEIFDFIFFFPFLSRLIDLWILSLLVL